ncbi:MAG: adenine phosphoribosyltransferase [Polymorphobacter sp.]|uniref:adenine phosphoribosyltransferase n=1 Tax=Polymorphobacter sp. TaxID=1909290 RepID=UPI003A86D651
MTSDDLAALIRTIPDHPKPGIQFRDITTLLLDGAGFHAAVSGMAAQIETRPDLIAGIEARGFLFGAALAHHFGCGLLTLRKRNKLPGQVTGINYALEYGEDRLEMPHGLVRSGQRVVLVDDLIATGGTAWAAAQLLSGAGAEIVQAAFLIDLPDLGGAARLQDKGLKTSSLISFAGH